MSKFIPREWCDISNQLLDVEEGGMNTWAYLRIVNYNQEVKFLAVLGSIQLFTFIFTSVSETP